MPASYRSALLTIASLVFASPALSQNNGLPSQAQSAVLVHLFAERGEACQLLRPWQAESLRAQVRDLVASFDSTQRADVAAEIERRRADMGCDDDLLTSWISASSPGFDREHLPRLVTAYRALATMQPRLARFDSLTGRKDYTDALARIDTKLSALEAAGVTPQGGMNWAQLSERQAGFATQIAAAITGQGDAGRFPRSAAEQIVDDIVRIIELWLTEPPQ